MFHEVQVGLAQKSSSECTNLQARLLDVQDEFCGIGISSLKKDTVFDRGH